MDILPASTRNARTDGNFHVPRSETPLAFTGERMTGAIEGQIEFEHYHRYCVARDLCDGRDVLDIASGEGYGAALLAGVAASVVGVDIDHASVAHAQASYLSANLRFLQGDALAVPLSDACVDVVVSFETLEHVSDQVGFINEVKRVLRPGGLFVVSTPDRAVYSAPGSDPNPYHVLELTDPEFRCLLATHFTRSRVLAQRPVLGSVLAARDSQEWRSYERRGAEIIEATRGLARAHYLVAVASDGELPDMPSSVYLDRRRVHDVMQGFLRLPAAEGHAARLAEQVTEAARERDDARAAAARGAARGVEASITEGQVAELTLRVAEISGQRDTARGEAARGVEALALLHDRLGAAADRLRTAEIGRAEAEGRLKEAEAHSIKQAGEQKAAVVEAAATATKLAEAQMTALSLDLQAARGDAMRASQQAAAAQHQQREAGHARTAAEHAAEQARRALDAVHYSTSWKLFAPVRVAGRRSPRLARTLRHLLKVTWWTLTLQIGHRYMMWRRHRMAASGAAASGAAPMLQVALPRSRGLRADPSPAAGAPSQLPARSDPAPFDLCDASAPPAVFEPDAPPAAEAPVPPPGRPHPPAPSLCEAFVTWHGHIPIHFPPVAAPEVSVIIPAYRGLTDLENCLRSLALHRATEPSFEVILIDDCPAEPLLWAVPTSGGLIKIANAENLGFLLACNRGAEAARGRFLCFLNSDTIVSAGWLRTLVEALQEVPGAALAGGMLLNEDGTIQEAGWRMLANGWGYPIGRGGHPRDGSYTYRRPVDCVTGSCFAVPRSLFEELGGFDALYAPAFYEEFDLAFRARARGLQVIYEPRSRVVHLGSASYGAERRDLLSSVNQDRFVRRHARTLEKHPWDTGDEFALRHAAGEGPVLLVVDYGVPQPDRHAGDVTMSGYLSMLATAGWRVVFGAMDGRAEGPAAEALERQGIELIRAPDTIEGWLKDHCAHVRHVWLARPEIADRLIRLVRAHTDARIVYYTHDLHHVRLEREATLHADAAVREEARRVLELEVSVFRNVDHVMAPSEAEAGTIRQLVPGASVTVLPPYHYEAADVRTHDAGHFAALSDVVFVGGFPHIPNVDAALFMANEVMPLVWRGCPDARLVLVGYAPPPEVQALAGPRVVVTGQVPSVEPFLERARVLLAGLRYGAGVKGKIVEALRLGVPVVTTPVGAEGIGIRPDQDAIVAEGAPALAEAVLELFRDPERCACLSAAGAALVNRRFSRAAARKVIGEVFHTPRCGICGSARLIAPAPDGNFREAFVCRNCFALGRAEALGRVLVGRLARAGEGSVAELARQRADLRIHEFGFVGGLADTMRGLPWFTVSDYFDGVPAGTVGPAGVRCEDLTRLTFADEGFDLVISQDVLEHVPDPARAFAEAARVLRPGGSHIFTIPQNLGLARSVTRAQPDAGKVVHILSPEYHGDPTRPEGALVFTEFGADLGPMLEGLGLRLIQHDLPVLGGRPQDLLRVFEAVKPR